MIYLLAFFLASVVCSAAVIDPRKILGSGPGAMPINGFAFKTDPESIKASAEEAIGEFKGLLKKQDEEIKKHGETTAETAKKLKDKEGEIKTINIDLKEAQGRIDELEKKLNRPAFGGSGREQKNQSPGEMFVKSEEFSRLVKTDAKSCNPVRIGSTFFGTKSTLSSDDGSAGVMVRPERLTDIVADPLRTPRLRDLMSVSPTSSNAIEYIEETELHQIATSLTADASDTDTAVSVKNVTGFYAGQTVMVGGDERVVDSVDRDDGADTGTITLTTGVSGAKSAGTSVTSTTFEMTPETRLKPNMEMKFELETVSVKTLAHGLPMTRQILEDAPRLRAYVDNRGMEGLALEEERQTLYGDGTGNQLQGIMTHPDVPTYQWSNGKVGDTKYDAIRRAMTLARLAEYPVSGVILHPNDVEDLETIKGSDGHYINIVMQSVQGSQVWRVPYVETTVIKEGEFLVGAFGLAAELFDRMQAMVRIAENHEDQFMRNMIQILLEERLAFAIYRPQAFVKGEFDEEPS